MYSIVSFFIFIILDYVRENGTLLHASDDMRQMKKWFIYAYSDTYEVEISLPKHLSITDIGDAVLINLFRWQFVIGSPQAIANGLPLSVRFLNWLSAIMVRHGKLIAEDVYTHNEGVYTFFGITVRESDIATTLTMPGLEAWTFCGREWFVKVWRYHTILNEER
jgi:hypothetical protein